jgi:hypothetical protein
VLRCSKEDGVRPYFDDKVIAYGTREGPSGVKNPFAPVLFSITAIADIPKRIEVIP